MHAADTNVLVRLVTEDDPAQTAIAHQFIATGVWVSLVALAETIWVLGSYYKLGHAGITDAVETLIKHELLTLQDSDAVSAALDLFRSRPALGFSDCLILELARKYGHLPLGTFDRDLAKADGAQTLEAP